MIYNSKFAHGIMFHRFKDFKNKDSAHGALTSKCLTKLIKFVGKKRILNPDEWIRKLSEGKLKKEHICLTFDDGLKSQIKIALPVLKRFNLKAFWFIHCNTRPNNFDKSEIFSILIIKKFKIYKKFLDKFFKYLNIDSEIFESKSFKKYYKEIISLHNFYSKNEVKYKFLRDIYYPRKKFEKIMENFFRFYNLNVKDFYKNTWLDKKDLINLNKKGHMIGMHSFSHPYKMSKLTIKKQRLEYLKNFNYLKRILKKKPISMSHPLDSYNKNTLKILTNIGILCGFRSHSKAPKGFQINQSELEMAREDPVNILKLIK
ncbi:polysaccharide deacetylase family protein [Pelagibacterales bacterium SAG-MED15]|nr:polysaccharide deacetylase family protein [Pelagibacterales bacterium SAG-MED15]